MNNIWLLFKGDMKRMCQNTVTMLIVVGLIVLPSLFTWFNVLACWDVFDNTGNLKVAVANTDEGYKSDLVPIEINVGNQVMSSLRANDQLNWVFTDEEDAIDGTKSGRYYAAVVIPKSFSKDMMTFYSDDVDHAAITYYSNEKKNAISPKVTDQGADKVSAEVNKVFVETLSEIGLGLSSSLIQLVDDSDMSGQIMVVGNKLNDVSALMNNAASTLDSYATICGVAQSMVGHSGELIMQVGDATDAVMEEAGNLEGDTGSIESAIASSITALDKALAASETSLGAVESSLNDVFASTDALAADSAQELRLMADGIGAEAQDYRDLAAALEGIRDLLPEHHRDHIQSTIDRIHAMADLHEGIQRSLNDAADGIMAGNADTDAKIAHVREVMADAQAALGDVTTDYETNVKPNMESLSALVSDAMTLFNHVGGFMDSAESDLVTSSGSLAGGIDTVSQHLTDGAAELRSTAKSLSTLGTSLSEAALNNDTDKIREVIGSDLSVMATLISAPVALERTPIHPIENFGSAMSPLYTTLALWIGVLVMMVTIKVLPSPQIMETLRNPRPAQMFIGRYGMIAVIALCQSTLMALGNMVFLQVQVTHPFLYMLIFWVSGLVFSFIIYTLVATFANLGKALGVVLLIVQVSGGGGSYPLQLLPEFVQNMSPYLPISHVVLALRAAMFGISNGDFWIELITLMTFLIPFILLGLVFRAPLMGFIAKFVEKVESTKLM